MALVFTFYQSDQSLEGSASPSWMAGHSGGVATAWEAFLHHGDLPSPCPRLTCPQFIPDSVLSVTGTGQGAAWAMQALRA